MQVLKKRNILKGGAFDMLNVLKAIEGKPPRPRRGFSATRIHRLSVEVQTTPLEEVT